MRTLALNAAHPADFTPDLLAIQSQPPARLPQAVMYVVFTLFAVLAVTDRHKGAGDDRRYGASSG